MEVGEVAAATAGDKNLAARPGAVVQNEDTQASAAGFEGAHEAGGAGAEDDAVVMIECRHYGSGAVHYIWLCGGSCMLLCRTRLTRMPSVTGS